MMQFEYSVTEVAMTWRVWLLFTITETVLCFSPGPAVMPVVVGAGIASMRLAG